MTEHGSTGDQNIHLADRDSSALTPNMPVVGLKDLLEVQTYFLEVMKDQEGDVSLFPLPYTQLTDAAADRGWSFKHVDVPEVTYVGERVINDDWLGGTRRQAQSFRKRPGFGESVSGEAYEVHQKFKYGSRTGTIKKLVVLGKGEESGMIKAATQELAGNKSPAVIMESVQKNVGRAVRNAVTVGPPGSGKRR